MPQAHLDQLLKQLCDKRPTVRQKAARQLGAEKTLPPEIAPALEKAIDDVDDSVAYYSLEAFGKAQPSSDFALSVFSSKLTDGEKPTAIRNAAAQLLRNAGVVGIRLLAKLTRHPDPYTRHEATYELGYMFVDGIGPEKQTPEQIGVADLAIDVLLAKLDDPDDTVRDTAMTALQELGAPVKARLERTLESERLGSVYAAGALLGPFPSHRQAIERCIRALGAANARMRQGAAEALSLAAGNAQRAVPALAACLLDDDPAVAAAAATALSDIQPQPEYCLTALIKSLSHKDGLVRRTATLAIAYLSPSPLLAEAVQPLTTALETGLAEFAKLDYHGRQACADYCVALGQIGPLAVAAAPVIKRAMRELQFEEIQETGRAGLRKIRPRNTN